MVGEFHQEKFNLGKCHRENSTYGKYQLRKTTPIENSTHGQFTGHEIANILDTIIMFGSHHTIH